MGRWFGFAFLVGVFVAVPSAPDCHGDTAFGAPADRPCPGVTISGEPVQVSEGGDPGSYTVVLDTRPATPVTVTRAANASQLSVTPQAVTFTSTSWNKPQTFTVIAVDDDVDEALLHTVTIEHDITTADPEYALVTVDDVEVSIIDDDTAGVTVVPPSLRLAEGGPAGFVTVVLDSKPHAAVVITPSAADGQVAIGPERRTLTPSNWDVPQSFDVSAVDDGVAEGDHGDLITFSVASKDPAYASIEVAPVAVVIGDNDTLEVAVEGPAFGADGLPATFRAVVNTASGELGYAWQAVYTGSVVASGDGPDFTFTPAVGGTYFVSVMVTDDAGGGSAVGVLHKVFGDAGDSVFVEDIVWAAARGITKGCNPPANDRFCPDDPVTRGQMAAFLVRALGLTDPGTVDFIDDDGSIFENNINTLATAGITRGCNPPVNDRYCPDDIVTRGQMTAFLRRALEA